VLNQRLLEGRYTSPLAYLHFLSGGDSAREWRRVAENLTVTETYFFRNADHFRALAEVALPARINARAQSRQIRLLSAGCASGEEPHSLAMVIRDHFPELASWDVEIQGVDVNSAMLEKARGGRYSSWSLRETVDEAKGRHFRPEGREFQLADAVRGNVVFEERNLVEANADLWQKASLDIIFCRNMMMYLLPEEAQQLVARMAQGLAPGGFLFLGHAETLRGLSQDFHLCQTHGTFYYQRKDGAPRPLATAAPFEDFTPARPAASSLLAWDPSATWMEVIRKASEKIAGLTAQSAPPPPAARILPIWNLTSAMELLRRERFSEALEAVRRLPPESKDDADTQLLQAVLLTNAGDLKGAQAVCQRLLELDELNAGAHYLAALCSEHAGDRAAAEERYRTAIYLDAAFSMPWLHLGLLARRSGRRTEAGSHLRQALARLAKEDAARILLFGGGFGREALSRLCRSEIAALEAAL
jgi:chemotaxis protein methyltransferase CheR